MLGDCSMRNKRSIHGRGKTLLQHGDWIIYYRPTPFSFNIHDCSIHSVAQSDHRLVNILYNMSHVQRGPSYWKFNESLLHDQTFAEQLNSFFEEFKKKITLILMNK